MKRTPLKRKTPLRRKTWMKRGKVKTSYARRPRERSFMKWARRQPCAARELTTTCEGRVQADHAGHRGIGQKSNDDECIPLCRTHHAERTAWTGEFKDWNKQAMREWLEYQISATKAEYELHLAREKRYALQGTESR